MPADKFGEQKIIRDLGDGLVLRRATREDTEALVTFNARIHGNLEKEQPDERVGAWTRDLMEQLLFGYRSVEELRYSYPDIWVANDRARALLKSLFAKQVSSVSPVA